MKRSAGTTRIIAIFVILGSLLVLAFALWLVWVLLIKLDPNVAAALLAGFFTIFVSTITVALGRYFEKAKEVEAAYRQQRINVYRGFLDKLITTFSAEEGEEQIEQFTVSYFRELHRDLILWSGSKAVKAYVEFFRQLQADALSAQSVLKMEAVFLALREDLGHSKEPLVQGDVARLFLKDTELLLQELAKNPSITLTELAKMTEQNAPTTASSQPSSADAPEGGPR